MSMPNLREALFSAGYADAASAPDWPEEQPVMLEYGMTAFEQGDFAHAVVQIREYVKANPEQGGPRLILGLCLYLTGQLVQAQVEFERVKRTRPDDAFVSLLLGLCLLRQEKFDKVIKTLGK
jgi:Flp pilus assembly protein TadD